MKLSEMSEQELKELESIIGQLLIDESDMRLSELQERIGQILEPEEEDEEETT